MLRLQRRQSFNEFWDVSFVDCHETFVHQVWNLSLRRWRESRIEIVDISKPEYGWGIPISKKKMPRVSSYRRQN